MIITSADKTNMTLDQSSLNTDYLDQIINMMSTLTNEEQIMLFNKTKNFEEEKNKIENKNILDDFDDIKTVCIVDQIFSMIAELTEEEGQYILRKKHELAKIKQK